MRLKFFNKKLYKTLCNLNADNSDKVKGRWESDLGTIESEDWNALCSQPSSVWCLTLPGRGNLRFYIGSISLPKPDIEWIQLCQLCTKCHSAVGSFIHCFWSCPHIQQFWTTIIQQLNVIFKRHLHLGARTCLLGLNDELPADFLNRDLLHILLHCARKCILALWITDKAPTLNQWRQSVMSILPFEAFSTALMDKPFLFYRTWDPFLDYPGATVSRRMSSGLKDLAWTKGVGP